MFSPIVSALARARVTLDALSETERPRRPYTVDERFARERRRPAVPTGSARS